MLPTACGADDRSKSVVTGYTGNTPTRYSNELLRVATIKTRAGTRDVADKLTHPLIGVARFRNALISVLVIAATDLNSPE